MSTEGYECLGMALTGEVFLRSLSYVVFLLALLPLDLRRQGVQLTQGDHDVSRSSSCSAFCSWWPRCFPRPKRGSRSSPASSSSAAFRSTTPSAGAATATDNIFLAWWQGAPLDFDLSMIGVLGALAAISGNGGLTNTALSGYVRDQGWGMGKHVGAIPSVIGGRKLTLCHVGIGISDHRESIGRFRHWHRFLMRDQLMVWMPACFVGVALPSMLSVQFLPRGTQAKDWVAAGMTADGLRDAVGPTFGQFFWLMTLFCGFLVLAPAAVTTFDGALRRWVDLCWTGVPFVRRWDPHRIRWLYFGAVCCYAVVRPDGAVARQPEAAARVGDDDLQHGARLQLLPRAGRQHAVASARAAAELVHPHRPGVRRRVFHVPRAIIAC